jgi:hypothetical protein
MSWLSSSSASAVVLRKWSCCGGKFLVYVCGGGVRGEAECESSEASAMSV